MSLVLSTWALRSAFKQARLGVTSPIKVHAQHAVRQATRCQTVMGGKAAQPRVGLGFTQSGDVHSRRGLPTRIVSYCQLTENLWRWSNFHFLPFHDSLQRRRRMYTCT
eukprot:3901291-Pleurochrysis_carterae.AAC.1